MIQRPYRIALIGGRQASEAGLKFAYATAKLLGEAGALVYTGGAGGVMEAASRGVQAGGGLSVGILKEADNSGANAFINIPVMTGMGDLRNGMILRSVQAAIAVEGSYGTLSEIGYALSYEKPVLGYHSWDIPGVQAVETPENAVTTILKLIQQA